MAFLEDPERVTQYLMEVEELAEDIISDKHEIIALDRRRNGNREAIRAMHKELQKDPEKKTWMAVGKLFMKIPEKRAKSLLERDQVQLDAEVNKLRSNLKPKVNKLRDLEYEPPVQGFHLNPLSKDEMSAVRQVISGKGS